MFLKPNVNSSTKATVALPIRKSTGMRRGRCGSIAASPARKTEAFQSHSKVRIQQRFSKPQESRNSIVLKQKKNAQNVVNKLEALKLSKEESIGFNSS